MRYDHWVLRTSPGPRNDALKAVDAALQKFNATGTEEDLGKLASALNDLKDPKDQPTKVQEAIPVLSKWTEDRLTIFKNDKLDVIPALRKAATTINDTYGEHMPLEYRAALVENFVANGEHMYCYKHYGTEHDWQKRVHKLASASGRVFKATEFPDAATPTLSPATKHIDDEQEFTASRNLKSNTPPNNRRIEFYKIGPHTTVHEMLHWCCHEQFRLIANATVLGKDFEYVLEGFTEWLACNAMNEWGGTSYFQIMTTVEAVVKRGYPDFGSMVAAYFGGSNVKEVAEKMLSYIAKEYLPGLNDPHKEIDTLLLSMERSRKTPEGSGATLDFKERVKNAFKGVPRDSAKQKLVNHQAWFAFLEKEQVFS